MNDELIRQGHGKKALKLKANRCRVVRVQTIVSLKFVHL